RRHFASAASRACSCASSRTLERMRTVLLVATAFAGASVGLAIAQSTILPETPTGLSEVIVKRVPIGMPIAAAQKELEGLGFSCGPGRNNSDFGPVDAIPFVYCERRRTGKEVGDVVKRWRVALTHAQGKVSGVQAAHNPIVP